MRSIHLILLVVVPLATILLCQSMRAATTAPTTESTTLATTRPAILQLLLPPGATASLDGQELGHERTCVVDDFAPGATKRVTLTVTFPGGAREQRMIDLEEGQTIPVAIATPQPDKAVAVPLQLVDPVLAVALSSDSRYLAIGLDSGTAVVWDLTSGHPLRPLQKHRALVQSVAFSPDSKQLLTGSGDNTAMLWDIATGEVIQTFKGHTDQVMCVAFSPDGRRIITGSMDKTAIIWNSQTAEKLLTISGHTGQVFGVAYSPDGKTVATGSLDRTGALWDAESGKLLFTLRGHPEEVSCIAFSPDGKQVATGSFDNSAMTWDTATGKKLRQTAKHEIDVYGVTYTPDSRRLLTSARDEVVIMWDAINVKKLRTFVGHNSDVGGAVVSGNGRLMFSCSRDGMVKMWDLATGLELASLMSDATTRSWAVVAPDGLFDASEPGRHMMGFRFAKGAGASLDQVFSECYHPGLLSEIYKGNRPFAEKPLGRTLPPVVKILSPRTRSSPTTLPVTITVEARGQSAGGLSAVHLYNNGTPIAVQRVVSPAEDSPVKIEFNNIALVSGVNQIRAVADNQDGSWQSAPAEIEIDDSLPRRTKGRLYVLAVGISEYADKSLSLTEPAGDAKALAEMLHTRAAKYYDRVDVIPLLDRDATQSRIEDALVDIAHLTQPQDSLIVLLCGRGTMLGEHLYFTPRDFRAGRDAMGIDDMADTLGAAAALHRAIVADLAAPDSLSASDSILRGAIERLSHANGIHVAVSLSKPDHTQPSLARALIATAPEASDMIEWFDIAAHRAGGQCSSQAKGFSLSTSEKP